MPLELALVMITTLELLKMVLVAPMKVHMDSLIKVKSWLGGSLLKILHQLNFFTNKIFIQTINLIIIFCAFG